MRRSGSVIGAVLVASSLAGAAAPTALAGRMYHAIELGTEAPQFTTDAAGNRVVLDASGSVGYAFPATPNLLDEMTWEEQAALSDRFQSPWLGPRFYQDTPENDYRYSIFLPQFMNPSGTLVAFNDSGRNGYMTTYRSVLIAQDDGDVTILPSSTTGMYAEWNGVVGLNSRDELLGIGPEGGYLFDIKAHELVTDPYSKLDVADIATDGSNDRLFWILRMPKALDDEGRIVAWSELYDRGDPVTGAGSGFIRGATLLLSPDGVLTEPMAVPEPGSLAVFALVAAAIVARRSRAKAARRRGGEPRAHAA